MAQTDSSTVNIDSLRINVEHFNVCQDDYAEGFVNFPQRNVLFADLLDAEANLTLNWRERM